MKRNFPIIIVFTLLALFSGITLSYASLNKRLVSSPPRNMRVQQIENSISITWRRPVRSIDGYKIYRSNFKKTLGEVIATINNPNIYSFVDSSVMPNIRYYYTVRSFLINGLESTNKRQFSKLVKGSPKNGIPLQDITQNPLPPCEPNQCIRLAQALVDNPRIQSAIEMNPLTNGHDYKPLLLKHINDIETNNTRNWSEYRTKTSFSGEDMLDIYLRKVAVSLHVEVHKIVPWSILDYGDTYLKMLISDLYVTDNFYVGRRHALFNGNPLEVLNYAKETVALYPNEPFNTPKDFLDLVIRRMHDDGWIHFRAEEKACDFTFFNAQDWNCLSKIKFGSSILTADFLYAVLQTYNIPSYEEAQYTTGAHTGIIMPTLNVGMEGNYIYDSLRAGVLLRPNKVPVSLSYDDLNQYREWRKLPICKSSRAASRQAALNYLNLINSSTWKDDVKATYDYTNSLFPNKGDFLRKVLIEDSIFFECQINDPAGEKYWEPTLSNEELNQWFTKITSQANR